MQNWAWSIPGQSIFCICNKNHNVGFKVNPSSPFDLLEELFQKVQRPLFQKDWVTLQEVKIKNVSPRGSAGLTLLPCCFRNCSSYPTAIEGNPEKWRYKQTSYSIFQSLGLTFNTVQVVWENSVSNNILNRNYWNEELAACMNCIAPL